ncbi:type II toxin-antitoxin system HipA family toxin [Microbacterium rhizomatis]|uniref:Type II toxin-antitoxin system HipA family toxin n=1 Tax=Microbacterium rhizomatis TaxID=1631477 RepID=A0A5J5J702_9MICO|nr:HipA domain-containing protein [Microbacterium rhizomatis]KAA9111219.1 type II toxin-antitoxin system HipA family toxin [Microbacterium rhizomatis]
MNVRVADVYKGTVHAAILRRTSAGTEFSYVDGYEGADVATTLALKSGPLTTSGASVPPYFAGLLPEGRRLTAIRRAIKASADDELSLLAAVGSDTVGDVSVFPAGRPMISAEPEVIVKGERVDRTFAEIVDAAAPFDRIGLPGVQDKVSGRMISYPARSGGGEYILKLNPPEFPHVVENEKYFLDLANTCGLDVVHARIIRDTDEQSGLLVTRFDRVATVDGTTRLAVEDACQASNAWPADKYSLGAAPAAMSLTRWCAAAPVAARDLFRQFVFASLTGNGDLHAKNIAMMRGQSEWRIAPAYDLPCSLFYGDETMALEMDGSTAPLSRKRARRFAADLGVPLRAAERVMDDLLTKLTGLPARIEDGALPFPPALNRDVARALAYRHRQLQA